ncbi:DJ-1/PfpI family protein [Mycoplasmopsis lipofaciens]|uniref:DJ-1/PfpI family protein n=1 Tax=Mycoplasmopsis lipofaciens TaxID=114884 RepID=UPI000488F267|nr:DJ-1/PfpI family protein [Mycoplasmopsis lipofaciens]
MKILVLVHNNFNDIELTTTISCLQKTEKITKITYFNPKYKEAKGQYNIVELKLENDFNINEYDAIFIPGGKGAKELRNDKNSLTIINQFVKQNKFVLAICDAPNVLFENSIIKNENYSSFPIYNLKCGLNRNNNMVSVDSKFITAKCAASAMEFGLEIVKIFFGENDYNKVKSAMFGN